MSSMTYAEALLAARLEAVDVAAGEGRITPEQRAIAVDLLQGRISEDDATQRFTELSLPVATEPEE